MPAQVEADCFVACAPRNDGGWFWAHHHAASAFSA
jgi:hypothetical protein